MTDPGTERCSAQRADGSRCERRGFDTHTFRGVRCWQHQPHYVDEGEEAYCEHQWT